MAFDGANVERSFGADDQEVSRAFLFSDVGEGLVVALVAVLEGMDESRIFPEKDPEEGEQLSSFTKRERAGMEAEARIH